MLTKRCTLLLNFNPELRFKAFVYIIHIMYLLCQCNLMITWTYNSFFDKIDIIFEVMLYYIQIHDNQGGKMKKIVEHYNAFKMMVYATTMLGNIASDTWSKDSQSLIRFIGLAYHLHEHIISRSNEVITQKLTEIQTLADANLMMLPPTGEDQIDTEVLYTIKSQALRVLQEQRKYDEANWFDYQFYNMYHPVLHFSHMHEASRTGHLLACRHVGLLHALGIGCEQSLDKAILRFKQAAYWGDIPAMYFLSYCYKLKQQNELSVIYQEVIKASESLLNAGITVLSDEMKSTMSTSAQTEYIFISSIFQDIVRINHNALNFIDYSFLEIIFMDHIDYYRKMKFINNYTHYEWREISNSSNQPVHHIGF